MNRITQLFSLIALALAFVASPVLAQTTGKLIADVNVTSHTLSVANGAVAGTFTAISDMGNQTARYGFVLRSKEGAFLGASETLGALSLTEKVPQTQQVSYSLPSVGEDANVFLNLSNDAGIVLALVPVGTVSASGNPRICVVQNDTISCTAQAASTLSIVVYEGGAQGSEVLTQTFTLAAGKKITVAFIDLLKGKDGGRYLISGTVLSGGSAVENFAQEYTNAGGRAKILSTSVDALGQTEGRYAYKAVILSSILGQSASSTFAISLVIPNCAETIQSQVGKGGVAELSFASSCEEGNATVELLKDGVVVDSAETSFATPAETAGATNSNANLVAIISLAALGILAGAYFFLRRKEGADTPSAPAASEVSNGASAAPTASVAAVALFALFALFSPVRAEAATISLYGGAEFYFCAGTCGAANEYSGSVLVSGTVTYPSSVNANSDYTILLNMSNTTPDPGAHGGCQDSSSDTWYCDAQDVRVIASVDGSSYDIGHINTASVIKTAPASGSIPFSATINPWAPYTFGCKPQWAQPTIKCAMMLDTSENSTGSQSIPVVAPAPTPTVEVNFSFLERMFKVFALSN